MTTQQPANSTMEAPYNLLWTSGWDSTFRLLDLLLVKKKSVQPYYIISRSRKSWEVEVKTMERIRTLVMKKAPETAQLLLPIIFKERSEIKIDPILNDKFNRLLMKTHLGDQYVYLASFAEESGVNNMELTIHRDDQAHKFIRGYVVKNLDTDYYRLKENLPDPDLSLFNCFQFPILDYTKRQMESIAKKKGFLDIMDQTWFCHYPTNDRPCGVCNPCRSTIEEGMIRRFPLRSRISYYMHHQIKKPIKKMLNLENKPVLVANDI